MFQYIKFLAVPLISGSLLVLGVVHMSTAEKLKPNLEPPVAPASSPYPLTIAGSGIVEPQSENISLGSNLSGVVTEVFLAPDETGKKVAAGDPLFRVDDRHLKAQLVVLEAQLEIPRANLARLQALPRTEEVVPARHRVDAAQANLDRATDTFRRIDRLAASSAITQGELVDSRKAKEIAAAGLSQAQAELALLVAGAWRPDLAIAEADIARIAAQVEQTKIEIERSLVRAPVDGQILQVNVRPGEFVGTPPGKALLVLGDMRQPRIRVDIDESDIPRFERGAAAKAFIRGTSAKPVDLKFVRVEPFVVPKRSLSGANTERVDTRVLQVLFDIVDSPDSLFVGQQVDVFIECRR